MADVLVVADDLTGANAAAAGFARSGLRTVTARAGDLAGVVAEMATRYDVVVATTDSRHAQVEVARERVAAVVQAGWPARLVCNRIDTTLRGNIGATTLAVRDEVAELTGSRVVVLCAPAHPAANRHTIGGTQLLDGRRLEETGVADDPRTPMRTSDVAEILGQQAVLATCVVPLATVTGDVEALAVAIRSGLDAGAEVILVDATTVDHLDRIAVAAVAAARGTDLVWVTSDPGPASIAMANALEIRRGIPRGPLLVVSGSATEMTRRQLRQLAIARQARMYHAPTVGPTAVPDFQATVAVLDQALRDAGPGDVVVLASVLDEADLRTVHAREAAQIPLVLARAVRRVLEEHAVDGVYSTGGDVTAALLGELDSYGLEISDEVIPLAMAGSLLGGPWDGLPIITKGGLVGDADTTVACVDHLRRNADFHRRQVPSAGPVHPPEDAEQVHHNRESSKE